MGQGLTGEKDDILKGIRWESVKMTVIIRLRFIFLPFSFSFCQERTIDVSRGCKLCDIPFDKMQKQI